MPSTKADLARVTEGELGVGEMGSIWVTDDSLGHAACALLSRRLFVFLDSKQYPYIGTSGSGCNAGLPALMRASI